MSWIEGTIPMRSIVRSGKTSMPIRSIPPRSWNNEVVGGIYRQEMARHFDSARYRKRQLVETKFSVLKRKFGGDLKARTFAIQEKEIVGKIIVGNIHRFLQFLIIQVFYRAKRSGNRMFVI
jgi:hypothetical protein